MPITVITEKRVFAIGEGGVHDFMEVVYDNAPNPEQDHYTACILITKKFMQGIIENFMECDCGNPSCSTNKLRKFIVEHLNEEKGNFMCVVPGLLPIDTYQLLQTYVKWVNCGYGFDDAVYLTGLFAVVE